MADQDKIYLGKPENQRDTRAVNAHKAKRPTNQNRNVAAKPAERPLPAKLDAQVNTVPRTGDPFSDSIFGKGLSVREVNSRTTFNPNLIASIEISRVIYQQLKTDDVQLGKLIVPEYLDYYHVFCLWARMVHIKNKNQESLTSDEEWLLDVIRNREYSLLEPMSTYLKGIGNIVTITGQHLYPSFPSLPTTTVGGKHGFYGTVTPETHNLYEEIPCFGVLAEAVQYSVSNTAPGRHPSVLDTATTLVNSNLLGFRHLQNRRPEAKDLALNAEINAQQFTESRTNTGINLALINAVSDILANTRTFRVSHVNFVNMSISGAQSQIITTTRVTDDTTGPDVKSEVQPQSLIKEKDSTFGAAIYSAYQLEKSLPPANWLCVNLPDNIPADPFTANRNNRRDLPVQFQQRVFVTTSQHSENFRSDIITCMVTAKR